MGGSWDLQQSLSCSGVGGQGWAWPVGSERESDLQFSRMALIVCVCLCSTLLTVPCSFRRGNPGWEECLAQSPVTMGCPASLPLTGPASPSCPRTPSFKLLGLGISFEVGRGDQALCPALHAVCSHAGCGLGLEFCLAGGAGVG